MNDSYETTEEYNLNKERKTLIVFDDMITDMLNDKKFQEILTGWFIRGRNLNISLIFITQSFSVLKNIIPNFTHYFIMKIQNNNCI